ncbi:hypothetical protein DY000_02031534 [Brassica cretica]|uniref:Uncharacterized protein n=1 Tax=Brassica cretica TaxID=69181 RepID=A0ABQ7DNX6_BRACR|nr:hypothetical protein DY000_02031534 [Brassica cretica]
MLQSSFATSLKVKSFWMIKWCPIGVNSVSTNRGNLGHIMTGGIRNLTVFFRTCGKGEDHPAIPYLLFIRLSEAEEVSSCTLEFGLWFSGAEMSSCTLEFWWGTAAESINVRGRGEFMHVVPGRGFEGLDLRGWVELNPEPSGTGVLANVQQMDDVTFCQIAQVFSSFVRRLFVRGYVTFCHHLTLRHHSTSLLLDPI